MGRERIKINDPRSYEQFLDRLIKMCPAGGEIEVEITIVGEKTEGVSTGLKVRCKDVYVVGYWDVSKNSWYHLGNDTNNPGSYVRVAEPSKISFSTIENAVHGSKTWGTVGWDVKGPQQRIMAFIVGEASRFLVVRSAVDWAVRHGHGFEYKDFRGIVRNWTKARRAVNVPVDDDDFKRLLESADPNAKGGEYVAEAIKSIRALQRHGFFPGIKLPN